MASAKVVRLKTWTTKRFATLLKGYLTQPEFAREVAISLDGSEMTIELDGGEVFDIQIRKIK